MLQGTLFQAVTVDESSSAKTIPNSGMTTPSDVRKMRWFIVVDAPNIDGEHNL